MQVLAFDPAQDVESCRFEMVHPRAESSCTPKAGPSRRVWPEAAKRVSYLKKVLAVSFSRSNLWQNLPCND